MEPKAMALFLAQALADKKGEDITILDVEALVAYTSFFVVCGGRSERQVQAMSQHVLRLAKEGGLGRPLGQEGAREGRWALLDFGDVVVHIFKGDERHFYDLEGLWQDAPRVDFEPEVTASA